MLTPDELRSFLRSWWDALRTRPWTTTALLLVLAGGWAGFEWATGILRAPGNRTPSRPPASTAADVRLDAPAVNYQPAAPNSGTPRSQPIIKAAPKARSSEEPPGAAVVPGRPDASAEDIDARRARNTDALIHEKELEAQSVLNRLDQDIDDVEQQARRATDTYARMRNGGGDPFAASGRKPSTNNADERAAFERALEQSFETTRQLKAIKAEFSRLYPQHLAQLRNGDLQTADSIYQQIIYQLHDRYIEVMSRNAGYDSKATGARAPFGYANEFEHVIVDTLNILRSKGTPDALYPNVNP